jgi:hypothetical protein
MLRPLELASELCTKAALCKTPNKPLQQTGAAVKLSEVLSRSSGPGC